MYLSKLKKRINQNPTLKRVFHNLIMHPVKTRPRWWIRQLQFLYIKKGKKSIIYKSVRKDLPPFNLFFLGSYSIIEDYSILNNAVGDIVIGDYTRIGIGNTIIGPVKIGNQVQLAQNITISGLNHNYQDVFKTIKDQGVSTLPVIVEDDVWIGANSVILPGVVIGKHSIVAAGSVVTSTIPEYSVYAGNPAKMVKQFDFEKKIWFKV